uniref:Follistatin like 1 n=1 Tax=Amphiprion percula TaxID=161767 RepID=A0A3P8T7A1_AMPPE
SDCVSLIDASVCSRTVCAAGRVCVSTVIGEPECRCLEQCDSSEHWVCGSNNKSYRNHCELHRDACTSQTKIHVEHPGRCQVVCFLSDRDWLRERVIQWVHKEAESDQVSLNASSASSLLQSYFQTYDNGDSQLDSKEFLRFLNHNESSLNLTFSNTLEMNLLLRSLCVDALIELSDENADWKLSLTEFINCLTPTFHPPERKCAVEDEVLEDGAETHLDCNKCVCACGNWVCTALTCSGGRKHSGRGEDEEMTEEEFSRRVAELNALQVIIITNNNNYNNNKVFQFFKRRCFLLYMS